MLALGTPKRHRNKNHLRFVSNSHAFSAAANPRRPTKSDLCSRGRLGAKRAMNSPPYAAPITVQSIGRATRKLGGSKRASSRSRSPASFGNLPVWASRALRPRRQRRMPRQSALQQPADRFRQDPRRRSDGLAIANMLTAIGLGGKLFHT